MRAFGDKIFVKVFEKESETESGILLVSMSKKEKPRFGEVVSIGDNVHNIKEGQIISFGNYALQNQLNDLFVMTEKDIFGYFSKV